MRNLIVTVGASRYLISSKSFITIRVVAQTNGDSDLSTKQAWPVITPATLLIVHGDDPISSPWLKTTVDAMLAADDVFCMDFLSTIVLLHTTERPSPRLDDDDAKSLLKSWGTKSTVIGCIEPSTMARSGPYFLSGPDLYKVSKLYPDPYGAFMYGVVQAEEDTSRYDKVGTNLIPVPSRLYFPPPSETKPLSGKRLAIKDIYDIRGLKTSMCCRSYEACYHESSQTAKAIQILIILGAVIVAKAKTSQLVSGLGPLDWIDYQCPFNPRGDGYLNPNCSSTGSAVGIAAYDWLDCSIGSDSLGSIVGPAAANGIFGLRPTQGNLSLDGSLLVSTLLDTPGHFDRKIFDLAIVTKAWIGATPSKIPPVQILYPADRFSPYSRAKLDIMESFIKDLERTVGIQATVFDIDSLWKEKTSSGPFKWKPINEFLATTLAHIQLYDSYHNNARFRSEHEAEFGYSPYVEPMVQYKWKLGAKLSRSDYNQACEEKEIFRVFLRDLVLKGPAVLLLPGGDPDISYRDEYLGSPNDFGGKYQGYGFKNIAFSALGGVPCVSFPVGQISYCSKITNKEVFEPVSLWLVGPAKSDLFLIELIKQVLESSGRPLSVKTGKTAF